MSDYLYCISTPTIPGVIRIASSMSDPRTLETARVARCSIGRGSRLDWVMPVADGAAAEAALKNALARYAEPSSPDHFRCDPMRARAASIQFRGHRNPESRGDMDGAPAVILPAAVLSLGLAVHFLGIAHGQSGFSPALIAAALFWAVHMLPMGSGGQDLRAAAAVRLST